MHIPDGFLSPQTYLPAYALCAGLWWLGLRRIKRELDADTLPTLALLTAVSFVLMMLALPLPGGTTVHAAGIALLAVNFGLWASFLAVSMVLAMQALLFGNGGVTALAVNALAMGWVGSASARLVWRLLSPLKEPAALIAAGWVSVVLPALLVAGVLGIQPVIAHDAAGKPLFFPFDLAITLPAVLLPHVLLGLGEGVLTWLGTAYLRQLKVRHAA
jgi:cobalt/nickel transport system permease protein